MNRFTAIDSTRSDCCTSAVRQTWQRTCLPVSTCLAHRQPSRRGPRYCGAAARSHSGSAGPCTAARNSHAETTGTSCRPPNHTAPVIPLPARKQSRQGWLGRQGHQGCQGCQGHQGRQGNQGRLRHQGRQGHCWSAEQTISIFTMESVPAWC